MKERQLTRNYRRSGLTASMSVRIEISDHPPAVVQFNESTAILANCSLQIAFGLPGTNFLTVLLTGNVLSSSSFGAAFLYCSTMLLVSSRHFPILTAVSTLSYGA